jgi:hypothetical protein
MLEGVADVWLCQRVAKMKMLPTALTMYKTRSLDDQFILSCLVSSPKLLFLYSFGSLLLPKRPPVYPIILERHKAHIFSGLRSPSEIARRKGDSPKVFV